jgi:hypothetical protein
MAGQMQVTGLPISGSGLPIAGSSLVIYGVHGPMELVVFTLGTFTLIMAGKMIWRMTPVHGSGQVRDRV